MVEPIEKSRSIGFFGGNKEPFGFSFTYIHTHTRVYIEEDQAESREDLIYLYIIKEDYKEERRKDLKIYINKDKKIYIKKIYVKKICKKV